MRSRSSRFIGLLAILGVGCVAPVDGVETGAGAEQPAVEPSVIRFDTGFPDPAPSKPLVAGGTARIAFDPMRFHDVIAWSSPHGQYWASRFHCYGYGCCETSFPTVGVHYRFRADQGWTDGALGDNDSLDVSIPQDADKLEVWFDVPGYEIKSWYCGCDEACARGYYEQASSHHEDYRAYDSRYAKNYVFPVTRASEIPTVRFGRMGDAPTTTATLRRGAPARLTFDSSRFYDALKWTQEYGQFWAYRHHCYGYGCCEVRFPDVYVHYRFAAGADWIDGQLEGDALSFDVPADAQRFEVWFEIPGYEIKTWYCGCDQACADSSHAQATWQHNDYRGWDSRYAQNYVFPVD